MRLKRCRLPATWLLFCPSHAERQYIIKVAVILLTVIGSLASIYALLPSASDPFEYHITVRTEEPNGNPAEANLDTSVKSTISGSGHSWMIDVLSSNLPVERRIIINAVNQTDFLRGRTEITLDRNPNHSVKVVMTKDESARAMGRVLDERRKPIIGAVVYVWGHETESTTTLEQGQFNIGAHAALGEPIRLHVEHQDFEPQDPVEIAGNQSEPIVLTRKRP